MSASWSHQFAARYQLRLPDDLAAWLDDGLWRREGGCEFHEPISPEELLDPQPGLIWGGFMPPDTLPLIGNAYGDALCLRIGGDGSVREFVAWRHGGGDWIPYGRSLGEALLYDAAASLADDASAAEHAPELPLETRYDPARWALAQLARGGRALAPFWEPTAASADDPLALLLAADVAPEAVRRDRCLAHLASPFKRLADANLARQVQVAWQPDFVSWLFDADLAPAPQRAALAERLRRPADDLFQQDWDAAAVEAAEVTRLRHDLAWACDVQGWAAERRGDRPGAIAHYRQSLAASVFGDQSLAFRSHWFSDGLGKFAAARLLALAERLPTELRQSAYLNILWADDVESLRARIRDHWLAQAHAALAAGDPAAAYALYYRAGWDYGLQYLASYTEVFDGLIAAASAAGWPALAELARTHRATM